MDAPKVFTDPHLAPARKPDEKRLKEVIDARITIGEGSHSYRDDDPTKPSDNELCIMEAVSYILGDRIGDSPPCTSTAIRELMITINDWTDFNRKRAQLKKLITEVINTAPTMWKWHAYHLEYRLQQDEANINYLDAEKKREQMIDKFINDNCNGKYNRIGKVPMTKIIPFVRELIAVAKFDGTALPPEKWF